jgi:hypothetical protein
LNKGDAQHDVSTGDVIITCVSTVLLGPSSTMRSSNWRWVKFRSRARSTWSLNLGGSPRSALLDQQRASLCK